MPTLHEALEATYRNRWARQRGAKSTYSQAQIAVRALSSRIWDRKGYRQAINLSMPTADMVEVTPDDIATIVAQWYTAGRTPATINKRLNCLSAMGVKVEGHRQKPTRQPKWWLRPEDERRIVDVFVTKQPHFVFFVCWTTATGLRIEESLALRWRDFGADFGTVTVPGTKTVGSNATLPLGAAVAYRMQAWRRLCSESSEGPFWFTYENLHTWWQSARNMLGVQDVPTATLKALRRSAARYLHVDCGMPLHMVQQYLRHESMDTTLEYLRLTGGYGAEEMRRYLK